MTNGSDSGAAVHRKPHHTLQWHSEWCGYYDPEDCPIYLPRLTEKQIRKIRNGNVRFRKPSGLSLFCPAWDHHINGKRGGPNDCRIIDRFGIPRLTCCYKGCEEELWKRNEYMVAEVVSDFLYGPSNPFGGEEMENKP